MGGGLADWNDVVSHQDAKVRPRDRPAALAALGACGPLGAASPHRPAALPHTAYFGRILALCPCLYAQIDVKVSAPAIVHLCEVTIGARIDSTNVYQAFQIQHPNLPGTPFLHPPRVNEAGGGDIMEALCAEVLTNHGLPPMKLRPDGWPEWESKAHLSLNEGKMHMLKLYGDLLIPAAPHNILVSVKSEAARERFVVSGNRLESVGFGFFNSAAEFWTSNRMNLLKRWGFIAIYMPQTTLDQINARLAAASRESESVNINGRQLYRPLEMFGPDMVRVAGRVTMDL